jgi:transcriptional regulator with XRE-family HTH domain
MRLTDELLREEVSDFERGKRVPPLNVLLAYAQAANLYVDTLIDDRLDLPTKLPAPKKTAGTKVR